MLVHRIESDRYSRQGKAVTNFKHALTPPQSDLANEIVRDPYNFDFLTLRDHAAEREMNFYLSAVDDLLRHADDKPSIGLILCKTRSKVIAEYALRNLATPVGVARYTTKLVESLPDELKGSLPSPKEIEAELKTDGDVVLS
jgi:hypothetical protein